MLFNSLSFLFVFLPVTYFVFWRLTSRRQRYICLTIAGYVFYSFWNYKFCALMLFSTVVSYLAGLGFLRWSDPWHRRLCMVVPVTVDLALLAFFKYANFMVANVDQVSSLFGHPVAQRGHLRSEEHTSELQSPCNLVCRLLLEKKKC